MKNNELASIFHTISELLELKGENPFKIRSYQKVAQVLETFSEEAAAIYQRGGILELREIPGVGEAIARKIEELLQTGKLPYYEKLKAAVPEGLTTLLSIPEVGPKTVKLLYEQLNITSIDELEQAVKEHKVRELKGMGVKSEENIQRGINFYKTRQERVSLGVAQPVAQGIVDALKKLPGTERIDYAGSLRRMKETIGDIDILVGSEKPERIMEAFTALPQVKEVLAKGITKSSIFVAGGLQVDLRVVEPLGFGAALQYFTGSKAHNIHLRELAVRKGLKINEYGVFDVKTDEKIAGVTEDEVYNALGLDWIAPELREDWGEIEAALDRNLPSLIQLQDIRGDLHAHSTWSDGSHSLLE
ncbi:MAG: helix-hairpin-helix domain-containing protein, partial [Spirochaetota bacterium]